MRCPMSGPSGRWPEERRQGSRDLPRYVGVEIGEDGYGVLTHAGSIAKDYLHSEIEIQAHWLASSDRPDPPARKNCARFRYAGTDGKRFDGDVSAQPPALGDKGTRQQRSVSVHSGQLMELPQGMRHVVRPEEMRLQSLDDCLSSWVDAPDLLGDFSWFGRRPEDRELGSLDDFGINGSSRGLGDEQFVDEMVQPGLEVLQGVADEDGEGREVGQSVGDIAGPIVVLTDQDITTSFGGARSPAMPAGAGAPARSCARDSPWRPSMRTREQELNGRP